MKYFFYFNETVLNTKIAQPKLIADYKNFSVWYKPKGVLCQGSKWADHTTINRWIETQYKFNDEARKAIIVHRLDKATDGLILIAHNNKYAKKLTLAFSCRNVVKIYRALVVGKFIGSVSYQQPIDDKLAISHIKFIAYDKKKNHSLVEVNIETGRKHQIRKHLSLAGFPIVGDRLYGTNHQQDLQLSAIYLAINLDDEKYETTLPSNFYNLGIWGA